MTKIKLDTLNHILQVMADGRERTTGDIATRLGTTPKMIRPLCRELEADGHLSCYVLQRNNLWKIAQPDSVREIHDDSDPAPAPTPAPITTPDPPHLVALRKKCHQTCERCGAPENCEGRNPNAAEASYAVRWLASRLSEWGDTEFAEMAAIGPYRGCATLREALEIVQIELAESGTLITQTLIDKGMNGYMARRALSALCKDGRAEQIEQIEGQRKVWRAVG